MRVWRSRGSRTDCDGDLRSATPDIGADEFASYTLATGVVGGGSVLKDPDQPLYNPGTPVQLTAVARGWAFDHWERETRPARTTRSRSRWTATRA